MKLIPLDDYIYMSRMYRGLKYSCANNYSANPVHSDSDIVKEIKHGGV